MKVQTGVIGGSGLYDMAEVTDREEESLKTPFGGPSGRHVSLHGGPAVLDAGGIESVQIVGDGRDRHDEPARGETRAGGGDLLRDARARDRLRLLAPRPRLGVCRHDYSNAHAERQD